MDVFSVVRSKALFCLRVVLTVFVTVGYLELLVCWVFDATSDQCISNAVFVYSNSVLLIAEGRVAFMGSPNQALDFFKSYVLFCSTATLGTLNTLKLDQNVRFKQICLSIPCIY